MFPKIVGFPSKSSHFNRVFHYKPSNLGYPYFLETPICSSYPSHSSMEKSITLPETNQVAPEKIDLWKFGDSYWKASFSGANRFQVRC